MDLSHELTDNIFKIKSEKEFSHLALELFHYQALSNSIYKQYLKGLKVNVNGVDSIEKIPFLPIEFFKTHNIVDTSQLQTPNYKLFTSSGTTGQAQSQHHVADISIYENSFRKCFEMFYGRPQEYCVLALLPSYLEREGSSLVYMAEDMVQRSENEHSGFYLHNLDELARVLLLLTAKKEKTILLGVTYALLDLAERSPMNLSNTIVMETGGMKGKRKEMLRQEVHQLLCESFNISKVHSEYGMTELLSQAYSKGEGIFNCPPWMRVSIRDVNDPFSLAGKGKTGGINVIDLANIHSCAFISTQDLGKLHADNSFEILGRFDNSDIRGCNLMVE